MTSRRRVATSLAARLKEQFERHCNADGLFPTLTPAQSKTAWSQFPTSADTEKRSAAVLIPIISFHKNSTSSSSSKHNNQEIEDFHILFTQRSSHMRTHAAEISFPGGGLEHGDETLLDTALRETQEELLHAPQFHWTVIGQGVAVPSIRGIPVTPILAIGSVCLVDEEDDSTDATMSSSSQSSTSKSISKLFPGNPDEVQRVFSISVNELLRVKTSKPLPGRLGTPAPVFPVRLNDDDDEEAVDIWGLTAYVLQPILQKVLKPVLVDDQQHTNSNPGNNDNNDEDATTNAR
eukprot:CAMPEP_0119017820 /NCGR_PEP_ID=MMETSP1176-20130426/17802_1 /TAXON_ID=265551 /ORGANISM="Synedropsis recta cf, Strain CCMP1620" /LENGTH=291 /DNA_ID=CAMNT_0006971663 /DNA_START=51 /DNA_END=922 /DNA_ORIENTATION=+